MLEKTQRRLFRVLFFLGCVLPTLAVAGYTIGRVSPGYQQSLLATVSQRLGVTVGCDRLETPRPGVYELHGVLLGEAAACERVRITRAAGGWRFDAGELRLANPGEASDCVGRLVSQGLVSEGRFARVTLGDATWLRRVRIATSQNALRITSEEGLMAELVGDSVLVDTAGLAAPLAWLPPTPITPDWADGATFTGTIEIEARAGTAIGRFDLNGIALEGLSAEAGALTQSRLEWRGDRLSSLEGRLALRDGVLSKRLMHGLAWDLEMGPSDALRANWEDLNQARFTDAAFRVALSGEGVRIETRGPAFVDGITPLLAPPARVLPVSNLVRAWHAGDAAEIPASGDAVAMTSRLPAPLAPR